jgi:hypothetical protein
MAARALALGAGLYSVAAGYTSIWGIGMAASLVFWGCTFLVFVFGWLVSSACASDHFNFLRLFCRADKLDMPKIL